MVRETETEVVRYRGLGEKDGWGDVYIDAMPRGRGNVRGPG